MPGVSPTTVYWISLLTQRGANNAPRKLHAEIKRRTATDTDSLLAWYGGSDRTGDVFATLLALETMHDVSRVRHGRRPKGLIRHLDPCRIP